MKESKQLLVDAGNTSLKWAILTKQQHISEQHQLFYSKQTAIQHFAELIKNDNNSFHEIIMVSVLGDKFNHEAHKIALKNTLVIKQIKSIKRLAGITNAYEEPHKLGSDRFIALIAAYYLSNKLEKKNNACIIIDSGTATTIDAVNAEGLHLGGLILPGLDLCTHSLLQNTQQLARWGEHVIKKDEQYNLFATNTKSAISSASVFGLSGAIESICLKMENRIKQNNSVQVSKYLCGGSAETLLPYLNSNFIHQKDLIMQGLKIASNH